MARSDRQQPEGRFTRQVPEGETLPRLVCKDCGFIDYENPKVVVGSVACWEGRILLCRRSINPRKGFWTLPAGYLEIGETPEEGALREANEEANASLELETLLAVYSIPRISQVQLIYRARLLDPNVSAGEETEELDLFKWEDIPWQEIAFPSVRWALQDHRAMLGAENFTPCGNPPGETGDY